MRAIQRLSTSLLLLGILTFATQAQVVLKTDFSNDSNAKCNMPYHLNVYNRISPINGFNAPHTKVNTQLCVVRPLGGIARKGEADMSKDSYKWDAKTGKFYTDFTLLKQQIDGVYQEGLSIYHLVLDNPSWAFQRAADGSLLGDTLKVSTYGNAEPPRDYDAWADYLQDVMSFLIDTYGEEKVLNIQFGIGREIGTPSHWSGTKEEFFEFYKRSVMAIHTVLPEAKVGTHFLWGSSKHPWGTDFVKWAKANNVHYDFIGVSFYPFYDKSGRTDMMEVYNKDFSLIKDIPEWNPDAKLEMHEFALIESMSKAGNAFKSADQAHQNAFLLSVMKMFYDNDMQHLFQWGDGRKYQPASTELLALEGDTYFRSTKSGTQHSEANYVDAIFAKGENQYSIMAYNYSSNPKSEESEALTIKAMLDIPKGGKIKYRSAIYGPSHKTLKWSDWQTLNIQSKEGQSSIVFDLDLPVFSFVKYEIKPIGDL